MPPLYFRPSPAGVVEHKGVGADEVPVVAEVEGPERLLVGASLPTVPSVATAGTVASQGTGLRTALNHDAPTTPAHLAAMRHDRLDSG